MSNPPLQIETDNLPTNEQLGKLAEQAVSFVKELKADGRLSIQAGAVGQNLEMDIALAWLLAESAKRGLAVSTDQITQALNLVFKTPQYPQSGTAQSPENPPR